MFSLHFAVMMKLMNEEKEWNEQVMNERYNIAKNTAYIGNHT